MSEGHAPTRTTCHHRSVRQLQDLSPALPLHTVISSRYLRSIYLALAASSRQGVAGPGARGTWFARGRTSCRGINFSARFAQGLSSRCSLPLPLCPATRQPGPAPALPPHSPPQSTVLHSPQSFTRQSTQSAVRRHEACWSSEAKQCQSERQDGHCRAQAGGVDWCAPTWLPSRRARKITYMLHYLSPVP